MSSLEFDIKRLIVTALNLEDLKPEDIDSDEPLFGQGLGGQGLGLDSIDGLELGMALRKTYGLKIEAATEELRQHFATVRTIAAFVGAQRGTP